MDVQVNWLAVALAAVAAMVVGAVWYAKPVFGNAWIKMVKLDEDKAKKAAGPAMATAALMALITAFVLAHTIALAHYFYGNSFLSDALTTSFWMWVGFQATLTVMNGAFELKPSQLTLINATHQFVSLMLMGLVIGLFGPA